jgi:hypothetical protein
LTPAGDRIETRGKATIAVAGAKQDFFVEVSGLIVRAPYKLIVDGRQVREGFAESLGSLRFKFSTEPGFLPLDGALNPVTNIRHVQLQDSQGRTVIQGDFTSDGPLFEPPRRFLEKESRLISTGVLAGASGKAKVKIEAARQSLSIEVEGLTNEQAYQLIVDGINLGAVESRSGFARAHFTNFAQGQPLPPALMPVTGILRVELLDARGQVLLRGEFRAGA